MPTAFVTGGTGFVGKTLVRQLTDAGWHVTALHRPGADTRSLEAAGATRAVGSIADRTAMMNTMPAGVDAVFHIAANTSIYKKNDAAQYRDNVEGTRNVAEAALEKGAKRFVHTSTISVYGEETVGVFDESHGHDGYDGPINYARTKARAEIVVRGLIKNGLDAVFCNPAHIMGAGDTGNWSRMFAMIKAGTMPAIPPGYGAFANVAEVARAHIAAAAKGRTGENYILGGPVHPFADLIRIVARLVDAKPPTRVAPAFAIRAVGWLKQTKAQLLGGEPDMTPEGARMISHKSQPSSAKAQAELDYKLVPLEETLQQTYDWLVAEGLLKTG